MSEIKKIISNLLSEASGLSPEECQRSLEIPRGGQGDLASTLSFFLSKREKRSPKEIAERIGKDIKQHPWIERVDVVGPYLNFFFSSEYFLHLISKINKEGSSFGKGENKGLKVIIEFPSVNPNKPWHIGHLRNALLGDSISRILDFSGYDVERMDYIDDLGLQVAQSLWGLLNLPPKESYKREEEIKFDHLLGLEYVRVSKFLEENKEKEIEVRDIIKNIEKGGDEKLLKEWKEMVRKCVLAQYQTAFSYGIYHDVLIFESDISKILFDEGLEQLKENKAIFFEKEGKNKGCWVVKLSDVFKGMKDPDKILIRSDGTATYTGKDLIFQMWKFGLLKNDFKYSKFILQPNGKIAWRSGREGEKKEFGRGDIVINVIGVEQRYPQKVIKEVLRKMGYEKEAENYVHLAYEHAGLKDAKFSGRKGTWVGYTADELLAEGEKRVFEKIRFGFSDTEKKEISKKVSLGAIRFAFLRTSPEKKIIFDWERVLSFEGDSGPYLQYSVVRIKGIRKRSNEKEFLSKDIDPNERRLAIYLDRFPIVVEEALKNLTPHVIADYLLNLAAEFNSFYSKCKVIGSERERHRLALLNAVQTVLENGLYLLGIPIPDRM